MASQFFVPKFITIEDKLAGILTFKQLFALFGAFLLSYIAFKINSFLGFIVALISFGSAIVLTFVRVNGKPFLYILPRFFDFVFGDKKFTWQQFKKITYKEIAFVPEIKEEKIYPKKKILAEKVEVTLEYPETSIKEKVALSLKEPISTQTESINRSVYRYLINPKNPYRFFPYVKLYKPLK